MVEVTERPTVAQPGPGRAGRNLPVALGVGLAMGAIVLTTLYTVKAVFLGVVILAIVVMVIDRRRVAAPTRRTRLSLLIVYTLLFGGYFLVLKIASLWGVAQMIEIGVARHGEHPRREQHAALIRTARAVQFEEDALCKVLGQAPVAGHVEPPVAEGGRGTGRGSGATR